MNKKTLRIDEIQPEQRKTSVIQQFEEMNIHEAFVLSHNSDPKPLLLAVKAQVGSTFTWLYEENGPENWKVRVEKVADPNFTKSLAELVSEDFRKADVFLKAGIDFCCHGQQKIVEACADSDIDAAEIVSQLMELDKKPSRDIHEFNNWSLGFLADYIVNIYHGYVRKSMPELLELSGKVYSVHGSEHPELEHIYKLVRSMSFELDKHMKKEENEIFPYIYVLSEAESNHEIDFISNHKTRSNDWHIELHEEHEEAGGAMKKIRQLTNDFALPPDACTAYKLLYSRLSEFEGHLYKHVHLENNILFPKAQQLEKQV